jgi:hypothetical protein
LCIFLQEFLIAKLVCVVYWWHVSYLFNISSSAEKISSSDVYG